MPHLPEVLGQHEPFILVDPEQVESIRTRIECHKVAVLEREGPGRLRKLEFPDLTVNDARNLMVLIELSSR